MTIDQCELTRIDGNGISINGYQRGLRITRNDFSWVGDSAMASWGLTGTCLNQNCTKTIGFPAGPDGRGGEQPWGTWVEANLVREIGIWQKQSSMWFQVRRAAHGAPTGCDVGHAEPVTSCRRPLQERLS